MSPAPAAGSVSAVLFDIDDTLYEVAHLVTQSWAAHRRELAVLGVDASDLAEAYSRLRHHRTIPAALALTLIDLEHPASLVEPIYEISRGFTPVTLPAQRGVAELLRDLRAAGVLTGVVSNGHPARQRAKLVALGLDEAFDVVVVGDGAVVPLKPSRVPFLLALDGLGVGPREALMVGDRFDYDIAPAASLGMQTVRLRIGNYAGVRSNDAGRAAALEHEDPELAWAAVRRAAGLCT